MRGECCVKSMPMNYCLDCVHYDLSGFNGERLLKGSQTEGTQSCRKKIYKVTIGEKNWIFRASDDDKNRYILGIDGKRPLICFGINPSTASPGTADPTIRSVSRIAEYNGYDGWVMLNIYPQRYTDPNRIDETLNQKLHEENLYYINEILELYRPRELWAAWGNLIAKRKFFKDCLAEISNLVKQYQCKWIAFGKINKSGHPRHPLYLKTCADMFHFEYEKA